MYNKCIINNFFVYLCLEESFGKRIELFLFMGIRSHSVGPRCSVFVFEVMCYKTYFFSRAVIGCLYYNDVSTFF